MRLGTLSSNKSLGNDWIFDGIEAAPIEISGIDCVGIDGQWIWIPQATAFKSYSFSRLKILKQPAPEIEVTKPRCVGFPNADAVNANPFEENGPCQNQVLSR